MKEARFKRSRGRFILNGIVPLALVTQSVMAEVQPTRNQGEAVLRSFATCLKSPKRDDLVRLFHQAPEWSDKVFKKDRVGPWREIFAEGGDLSVIEALARKGKWGRAVEILDQDRVRRRVAFHGIDQKDCFAFRSQEPLAEVLLHWDGNRLTIVDYADAHSRKTLQIFIEKAIATIKEGPGSDGTRYAMSLAVLGSWGPMAETAIPALSYILKKGDPKVRPEIAMTLWMIDRKAETVVPPLVSVLLDRTLSNHSREKAASYLGTIGVEVKGVVDALSVTLAEKNHRLRVTAASSLWKITGDSKTTVPVFLEALGDPEATYLASDALVEIIKSSQEDPVQLEIGNSLIEQVLKSCSSDDLRTRTAAMRILGDAASASKPVLEVLEKMLEDEEFKVQLEAKRVLKKLQDQK